VNRWKRTLMSVLIALTLLVVQTTPAFGYSCAGPYYVVDSGTTSTFAVCITQRDNGYDAKVSELAGQGFTYLVDFNLIHPSGWVGDAGAFYISPGQTKTYFFNTGYFSWAVVRVYWRANHSWFPPMDSPTCPPSC
jgi:hypothetical protein